MAQSRMIPLRFDASGRLRGYDAALLNYFDTEYSMTASCWSPGEKTNCGQAVDMVEKIIKAIQDNDSQAAENLIGEVSRVANLFREYYPTNFRQERIFADNFQKK